MTTLGTLSIHLDGGPCRVGCALLLSRRADGRGARRSDRDCAPAGRGGGARDASATTRWRWPCPSRWPRRCRRCGGSSQPPARRAGDRDHHAADRRRRRAELLRRRRAGQPVDRLASRALVAAPRDRAPWPSPCRRAGRRSRSCSWRRSIPPAFAARLIEGGLLEALVELPAVDKVALQRAQAAAALVRPRASGCARSAALRARLLERALERRLFLDCYVAARIARARRLPGARRPVAGGGRRRPSAAASISRRPTSSRGGAARWPRVSTASTRAGGLPVRDSSSRVS